MARDGFLRHWIIRALTLSTLLSFGAAIYTLSLNPFAAPLVLRTASDARLALERALSRRVTPEWVEARMAEALAENDLDRVQMVEQLAQEHGVDIAPDLTAQAQALRARSGGVRACGQCAVDVTTCQTAAQVAACNISFELTPIGDVNALRRNLIAGWRGKEVDTLEVGLAAVGLGATAAVLVTGGSSALLKSGATLVRVARRTGNLRPAFARTLASAADLNVKWSAVPGYLARSRRLDEVVDPVRLTRLTRIVEDLDAIVRNTSPGDAIYLLRHVDTADDAARLARVSAAMGDKTRRTTFALGKARTFRALVRLSDLVLALLGLAAAIFLQLLTLLQFGIDRLLRSTRPVARTMR